MSYVEVQAERCEVDPEAVVRAVYDVEELKESIARAGQIEPVLAYEKNGKCYVYVGVRRLLAIKELAREGRLDRVKALLTDEPAGEEKYRRIYEENASRSGMTIYDMVYMVWTGSPLVDELVKHGDVSSSFVARSRGLKERITVEELRRWYGIEKALGVQFLTLEHMRLLGEARREIRDYAVFAFVTLRVPARMISDLETFLASVVVDDERARSLGIERPALSVPLNEPATIRRLMLEEAMKERERRAKGAGPVATEAQEEEAPQVLIIYDYEVVREPGRVVILYAREEPRVEMKRVAEGDEVEKDGKRYRVHIPA